MKTNPSLIQTEHEALAKQCAALLRQHDTLVNEMRELMLKQKITRAEAESINPFQWASECVMAYAMGILEP